METKLHETPNTKPQTPNTMTMSTKCPYCRRRYQHGAAYEKHVRAAHHDILLFHRQTADFGLATSSMQTSFIEDDLDSEGVPRRPDTSIPYAGRPLADVTGYEELNKAMLEAPWSPFSSERDFNLAS